MKIESSNYWDRMMIPVSESKVELTKYQKFNLDMAQKLRMTKFGLRNENLMQKKQCKNRFSACHALDDYEEFEEWLQKQMRLTQRRINGKEIKNKEPLRERMQLYHSYLDKVKEEKRKLQKDDEI